MNTERCLFCQIVRGEVPSLRIFEDDQVLAFMDIGPIIKGHALVIPKMHYDSLAVAPPELLAPLLTVVQRIMRAQEVGLGAEGINVIQNSGRVAGQSVKHLHIHIIPRFSADGHHWNWTPTTYRDSVEMVSYSERLSSALSVS